MGLLDSNYSQGNPQVHLHPNEKTTSYTRALIVERVERLGWTAPCAGACPHDLAIQRRTVGAHRLLTLVG